MGKYQPKEVRKAWLYEGGDLPSWLNDEFKKEYAITHFAKRGDEDIVDIWCGYKHDNGHIVLAKNQYLIDFNIAFGVWSKDNFERDYKHLANNNYRYNDIVEAAQFLGNLTSEIASLLISSCQGKAFINLRNIQEINYSDYICKNINGCVNIVPKNSFLKNYEEVK